MSSRLHAGLSGQPPGYLDVVDVLLPPRPAVAQARVLLLHREHARNEPAEQNAELLSLKNWLEEVRSHRPLSQREKLERDLNDAVSNEDYEKAAQVRDALRNLKPTE